MWEFTFVILHMPNFRKKCIALQTYYLSFFECNLGSMEPEKLNFGENRKDEHNYGHTKNEWGSMPHKNRHVKIRTIVAYTVIWDVPSKEKRFYDPNLS